MREALIELLDRDPFVPFRIVVSSGSAYEVANPHWVALGESVLHLMAPKSDRSIILRLNQIASFQVLEGAH